MRNSVRIALCYLLATMGLGFFVFSVAAIKIDYGSRETVTAIELWCPVAAGTACMHCSIRLWVAPQLRGGRAWMREAGQNAAALSLLAGSFVFSSLTSDEARSLGGRVLLGAIMPAMMCACLGGWIWLSCSKGKSSCTEMARVEATAI